MVRHFTSPRFWQLYETLPSNVRELADKSYALLKKFKAMMARHGGKLKLAGYVR